jgi:hypothetical protein
MRLMSYLYALSEHMRYPCGRVTLIGIGVLALSGMRRSRRISDGSRASSSGCSARFHLNEPEPLRRRAIVGREKTFELLLPGRLTAP